MLRAQRLVPRVPPRLLAPGLRAMAVARASLDWAFGHYLEIAPPEFVAAGPPPACRGGAARPPPSSVSRNAPPFARERCAATKEDR